MLHIPSHEQDDLRALLWRSEYNLRALELFSRYLNLCPRYIQPQDVQTLTQECAVDAETACRLMVAAAFDVEDRELEEGYLKRTVHLLDAHSCRQDLYYQTIRLPQTARGSWKMGYKTIAPYELFTSDDLHTLQDGREIPQVGFFTEAFRAPVVEENGREWMTVTPSEINTMTADIQAAHGRVAVFGLGLGYYAFMASEKPDVERVVVIEREESVISLFRQFILPQFPHADKVTVIQADAYEYVRTTPAYSFDCAYVDIWHDVLDGVEMYLKMKRLEHCWPQTHFLYWIEPSMLAWLRGMALMEIAEGEEGPMMKTIGDIHSMAQLKEAISDDGLRAIAAQIPLEVAQRS